MRILPRILVPLCLPLLCGPALFAAPQNRDWHRSAPLVLDMSEPFGLNAAPELPEWSQIRHIVEGLQTEPGSLALLQELPLLEARYGTEASFQDLVAKWRSRIPNLTEQPAMEDLDASTWLVIQNGPSRTISITFHEASPLGRITILAITWVDHEVTDLSFTGGFESVLEPGRQRWPWHQQPATSWPASAM